MLDKVYDVMIIVGFVVPTIGIIFGSVDSVFDIDFGMDGLDTNLMIPFNMSCCMFGMIVCGFIGKLHLPGGIVIPLICAICAYILLYKLVIQPLKRNKPYSKSINDFIGSEASLIEGISENGLGVISIQTDTGKITYCAKSENGKEITRGSKVIIVAVLDNMTMRVREVEN